LVEGAALNFFAGAFLGLAEAFVARETVFLFFALVFGISWKYTVFVFIVNNYYLFK